jgi:transcriptional regulator with XRE-family HTH domain
MENFLLVKINLYFSLFKYRLKNIVLSDPKTIGRVVGVQKAQISRLESNASNVTMDTLMKVFSALKAKVKLQIELPNAKFNLAGNL